MQSLIKPGFDAFLCHAKLMGGDADVADFALDILDVDKLGLDNNDRTLLLTLIQKFSGGPVGLETLAASIGEDSGTLEDVYEPYLVQNEYISRTRTGRIATDKAYRAVGIDKTED